MTAAEFQAHVEELSTGEDKKKWKIQVGELPAPGFYVEGWKRKVWVSEKWLIDPDLSEFNFSFAASNILEEWKDQQVLPRIGKFAFWSFLILEGVAIIWKNFHLPSRETAYPILLGLGFIAGALYAVPGIRQIFYARSWDYHRKLLETTKDPGRTRSLLAAKGMKPEILGKFDALVCELGLEDPDPNRWQRERREEQATLAELQWIADEVSEAFHGPKWKVVPRKWGNDFVPLSFFRRIQVGRAWLLKPDLAHFRFRVVLGRTYQEFHARSVGYQIMLYSFLTIGFGFFLVPLNLHPFGISLNEIVANAALIHVGVFNFWLPYYDRKLRGSEAFLTRVLELSKDPEALRAHLLQEKASPENLAKFDAMVAAQG